MPAVTVTSPSSGVPMYAVSHCACVGPLRPVWPQFVNVTGPTNVTQTPAAHDWVGGQTRPHAPQFSRSCMMSASQPSTTIELQSVHPASHVKPQIDAEHVRVACGTVGHDVPHVPQFAGSTASSLSQPSLLRPLQSAYPMSHVPTPHTPAAQPAVACAGTGHRAPQRPQLKMSVPIAVSQPFDDTPSQSAHPASHVATPHVPRAHSADACGGAGHE